ncbi:hypothetical protein [Rhizobium sp. RM]|uniref:hypothetical protein n=1 Tax=Rhizobium sp. RM TaxID=2748079 RepID=UPI00110D5474|nr:hypothetical protein [Rhizobium sp. RM]NWJ27593.1 hypothetical protein [Rhizobium sp. RM]TMV19956.1 hypothetical protein BJG94_11160 [Rhizobium sp. Td3]
MRDLNKQNLGKPDDQKQTRRSTWRPRGNQEDVVTNNDEGAPPTPIGQAGDREQGTKSDGPTRGQS